MAYDPQLRLDPALFNELRRVYPELTENEFHVLLANLLDNRPLPSNAPFLKLLIPMISTPSGCFTRWVGKTTPLLPRETVNSKLSNRT